MDVHEWLESPGVREQAKAGRDPGLFADSKQGRGRLKNCGGGNKEWGFPKRVLKNGCENMPVSTPRTHKKQKNQTRPCVALCAVLGTG